MLAACRCSYCTAHTPDAYHASPPRRTKEQLVLKNCRLVIPYDEFLIVHHVMVEWQMQDTARPVDMYTYFENLLHQFLRKLTVGRWCKGLHAACMQHAACSMHSM